MSAEKPRRLGRGLDALIPGSTTGAGATGAAQSDLQRVAISRIRPNPFQPRQEFDAVELAELQASLAASGLLQPIVLRRQGDAYELIAGERRLRAATNLGWSEITSIVKDYGDREMLVFALVENLQRADLNAVEEARGYRRLIDEFELTQQQVAAAVGKDRTTVTNLLRVLTLPQQVLQLVERGSLTPGHARALLALDSATAITDAANDAIARGMSVRQLEQRVRELSGTVTAESRHQRASGVGPAAIADPSIRRVQDDLRKYLQTDVKIDLRGEARGKIELSFYSVEDLDRILDLILREARRDF